MKKCLITGAEGFIGSHLVEQCVLAGYDVRAFILYNSFDRRGWLEDLSPDIQDQVEVITGDIRDPFGVANAMRGCDIVLHLAALIAIPYSYHSPATYIDTNVTGTLNVVQAARDQNISRVIVTSTSEVYGTAQFVPITEDHPLQGQSPYSASKIGADMIALSYHKSFQTPVTVLRPFNTYGPRQSARAVIPTIITQIAHGKRQIKLGALSPTRDFSYVTDTASGFLQAAACEALIGESVNIGSGFEISIGDTASLIAELMGSDIEVLTDEQRLRPEKSEVNRLFAGTDKAVKAFGWAPEHAGREGFSNGLKKTIAWFSNPANISHYAADRYVV